MQSGLDGHQYEIDLCSKNATKPCKELAVFMEHGSRLSNRTLGSGRRGVRSGGARSQADENRAIREWAQAEGYEIAERGRIKQEIVDASTEPANRTKRSSGRAGVSARSASDYVSLSATSTNLGGSRNAESKGLRRGPAR